MLTVLRKHAFWPIVIVAVAAIYVVFKFILPLQFITTGSMAPTIMPMSLAIDVPVSHVEKGQVITFVNETGGVTTHRVIGFSKDGGILTQGDANDAPDLHTTPLTMKGVVGAPIGGTGVPVWLLAALIIIGLTISWSVSKLRGSKQDENMLDTTEEATPEPTPV